MIDLKERVSQFLRARTLSNLLLVWGRLRDGGVTVAVMSALLVGVLAMRSIWVALITSTPSWTTRRTLMRSYALAGATQLDQTPESCVRAMAAAVNANLASTETSRV